MVVALGGCAPEVDLSGWTARPAASLGDAAPVAAAPTVEAPTPAPLLDDPRPPCPDPADLVVPACAAAMVDAWADPTAEAPSEEAYRRTLAWLEATPRSATQPAWQALGRLRGVRLVDADWVDRAALAAALEAVAQDEQASPRARRTASEVAASLAVNPR